MIINIIIRIGVTRMDGSTFDPPDLLCCPPIPSVPHRHPSLSTSGLSMASFPQRKNAKSHRIRSRSLGQCAVLLGGEWDRRRRRRKKQIDYYSELIIENITRFFQLFSVGQYGSWKQRMIGIEYSG